MPVASKIKSYKTWNSLEMVVMNIFSVTKNMKDSKDLREFACIVSLVVVDKPSKSYEKNIIMF